MPIFNKYPEQDNSALNEIAKSITTWLHDTDIARPRRIDALEELRNLIDELEDRQENALGDDDDSEDDDENEGKDFEDTESDEDDDFDDEVKGIIAADLADSDQD